MAEGEWGRGVREAEDLHETGDFIHEKQGKNRPARCKIKENGKEKAVELYVAIVEDEAVFRKELCACLMKWERETGCFEVIVREFESGKQFQESQGPFDIIFMDIEMETADIGLKIAKELKDSGSRTPIVFLSSHKECVFLGYHVSALDFLTKPISERAVFWCMNQVTKMVREDSFLHKEGRELFRVKYRSILYFEADLHYVDIVTDDKRYSVLSSIKKIKEELPEEFVQCHRSYIVNISRVEALRGNEIYFDNNFHIEMSERYRETIRDMFLKRIRF